MKHNFPENTVFVVVSLISVDGDRNMMVAEFAKDSYEERRADFLDEVLTKSQEYRAYVEFIDVIRSDEDLEAIWRRNHPQKVRPRRRCRRMA